MWSFVPLHFACVLLGPAVAGRSLTEVCGSLPAAVPASTSNHTKAWVHLLQMHQMAKAAKRHNRRQREAQQDLPPEQRLVIDWANINPGKLLEDPEGFKPPLVPAGQAAPLPAAAAAASRNDVVDLESGGLVMCAM